MAALRGSSGEIFIFTDVTGIGRFLHCIRFKPCGDRVLSL